MIAPQTVLAAADYAAFRDRLVRSACALCALCEKRTNIVADRGNPGARMMVIGEAPGRNEDLQGRAFVGQGGKLFDKVMAAAGFDTGRDFLIANVVKCRPPDNRRPKPAEAAACRPYLDRQFELVKPEVVVLLGATALKYIAPERPAAPMGDAAGELFDLPSFPGVKFMVFYHPAAILYNRRLLPAMEEHARKLREFLDGRR